MEEVTKMGEPGWGRERWVKRVETDGRVWWMGALDLMLDQLLPAISIGIIMGTIIGIAIGTVWLVSRVWKTARVRWMVVSVVEAGSRFKLSIWLWTRPGLLPLLTDCLGPDNSKAVQRKAILALNRLITYLLRQYAAITEPTDTEISSLNATTLAFDRLCLHLQPEHLVHIQEILPVIVSIFTEPVNRREAQMNLTSALGNLAYHSLEAANLLNDSGVMRLLLDTARKGMEDKAVLVKALRSFYCTLAHDGQLIQPALDMGAIDVLHEILKRPNDGCDTEDGVYKQAKRWKPWLLANVSLSQIAKGTDDHREAILSKDGLIELVLQRGMEVKERTHETFFHHWGTIRLVGALMVYGSGSQLRRLMYNPFLLRLFSRYLRTDYPRNYKSHCYRLHYMTLDMALLAVQAICGLPVSASNCRLRRLLFDDAGITDAIRRLSLPDHLPSPSPAHAQLKLLAISIFDTYLKDPLPPRPPSKLPTVIYTKNYPYYIPQ